MAPQHMCTHIHSCNRQSMGVRALTNLIMGTLLAGMWHTYINKQTQSQYHGVLYKPAHGHTVFWHEDHALTLTLRSHVSSLNWYQISCKHFDVAAKCRSNHTHKEKPLIMVTFSSHRGENHISVFTSTDWNNYLISFLRTETIALELCCSLPGG